ncbi:MAG: ABC transporter ATP-binding protein [Burkholderiales bacterium]|nr:ABC transporter ATP-binding protein [Burkholderiales bacterium]
MNRNLFAYIWSNSRREQLSILAVVLLSLPFYFVSLDLPKYIVNDAIQGRAFAGGKTEATLFAFRVTVPWWLGGSGAPFTVFDGFSLERFPYLFALSGAFLLLVLVNGGFKWFINLRKGKLGELLLKKMRFDLFSLLVRFSPESVKAVKPSEMATVINNEVEPIGGFVGDAFITPVFLGGQAITALTFIVVQSPSLGVIAAIIVAVQALIIPRLRREQLRLGKQRQLAARALAGQIGEVVEGISAVHSHGTSAYELARIDRRLSHLFKIRFDLYNRKFFVKFINNLLAQFTPFIFYSLGGYLALTGQLDIGQLVAVIAAYRELPPPVKELIDWDQQRMDVQVKFDQVVEQFATVSLIPEPTQTPEPQAFRAGQVEAASLKVVDGRGHVHVDNVSFMIPLPAHVALGADGGDGPDVVARILGRQLMDFSGRLKLSGYDIAAIPQEDAGRAIAYAGPETVIFQGTIRENVSYGLNLRQPVDETWDHPGDWIDYAAAGATGPEDLDARIIEALRVVGLDQTIYRLGLGGLIDAERFPTLAVQTVDARRAVFRALAETGSTELIEPFDPAVYNRNATVSENLLFGIPIGVTLAGRRFIGHPFIRETVATSGLTADLTGMGREIAVTMIDIFTDLPPDHFLFEQFSFIRSEELPDFAAIVARLDRGDPLTADETARLVELTLDYIEPRHRLGLLDAGREARIVAARALIKSTLPADLAGAIEFYDPDRVCAAAPLKDNLLFGRITYGVAGAEERVLAVVQDCIVRLGLEQDVYRLGLDFQCGPGGRFLTPTQRAAVALARALVKRPCVLVVNEALVQFGEAERKQVLERIQDAMRGASLIVAMKTVEAPPDFDHLVTFAGPRLRDTLALGPLKGGGRVGSDAAASKS